MVIQESSTNPTLTRKDTADCFQWRIRNLFYPKEVYSVEIDPNEQKIVVRTSNKKYFKKIDLLDLTRVKIQLDSKELSWTYSNNTLVISYKKPPAILKLEADAKVERANIKVEKEGDWKTQ
eukprot:TRINITY_DN4456_c0_g1_i1.p1 TRINITY_DN4456_c0_g1~~TRINITY_DN4456_c0_g1_i1.p1  ORF type:complete len:121 (-),score=26.79 TRINITY_DN4456_c0_g1_i1:42-404(-)